MSFYSQRPRDASSFRLFSDSMMQDEALPLSELVNSEVFEEAFERFEVFLAWIVAGRWAKYVPLQTTVP